MKKFKAVKKNLLVVEVKNCWIRATVFKNKKIINSVFCMNLFPDDGVNECLELLKQKSGKVPSEVVLLTHQTLPSLVNLQIDPQQPYEQVEQMLSWEKETVESLTIAPSGLEVLLHQDFLPTEVYDRLFSLVQQRRSVGAAAPELNELVGEGIITEAQSSAVDSFLHAWTHLESLNEVKWVTDYSKNPVEDTALASYISTQVKSSWQSFFEQKKIRLHSILPWHLSSISLVRKAQIVDQNYALIDCSLGQISAAYFEKGQLQEVQVYSWDELTLPASFISDLVFHRVEGISVIGLERGFERITEEVKLEDASALLKDEVILHSNIVDLWPSIAAVETASKSKVDFKLPLHSCALPPLPFIQSAAFKWVIFLGLSLSLFGGLAWSKWTILKDLHTKFEIKEKEVDVYIKKIKKSQANLKEFNRLTKRLEKLTGASGNKSIKIENDGSLNNEKSLFILARLASSMKSQITFKSLQLMPQGGGLKASGVFRSPVAFYEFLEDFTDHKSEKNLPQIRLNEQSISESFLRDEKVYEFSLNMEFE